MRTLVIVFIFFILLNVGCSSERSDYDAGIKAYKRRHYAVALSIFESRAMEENDPIAQFCLGFMYNQRQVPIPKEHLNRATEWYTTNAKKCYEKAANQNYAPAQNNLAIIYFLEAEDARIKIGEGEITPDVIEDARNNNNIALQWFQKAAKQQSNHAPQYNIALIAYQNAVLFDMLDREKSKYLKFLPEDSEDENVQDLLKIVTSSHSLSMESYETSVYWFTKAANNGYDRAQYELANRYYYGEGVDKNLTETERWKKAVEWYQKAENYAPAQNSLARMYYRGEGVDKNLTETERWKKAVEWYRKAVEQDNADAQFNLAEMYKRDEVVDESLTKVQRLKKVEELYKKAAEQHYGSAQNNLAKMYTEEDSGFKNSEKAIRLLFQAAQQGNLVAQANVGRHFEKGINKVPQNKAEAYYWYSLALRDPAELDKTADLENYVDTVNEWRESLGNQLEKNKKNEIQERLNNWKPRYLHGTGTGFYVDKEHIITNAHVAAWEDHDGNKHKYDELRIGFRYVVDQPSVELVDHDADLALLLDESSSMYTATFRKEGVDRGEKIALFGYPLSFKLSYEGNATSGNVSGLSGPINSVFHYHPSNLFQHTAPQQGGNSGGPVFDGDGNVVGISVGSLYGLGIENVHFAIKFEIIEKFLNENNIPVNPVPKDTEDLDEVINLQEISTKAEKFTVPVLCYKNITSPVWKPPVVLMEIDYWKF